MEPERSNEHMSADHARWSSQHGHWLKDAKVWRSQHLDLLDAFREIEKLIRKVERELLDNEHEVKIHEDEIRIHRTLGVLGGLSGKKGVAAELAEVHNESFMRHKAEEQHHEAAKFLHEKIMTKIASLSDVFGSNRERWFDF